MHHKDFLIKKCQISQSINLHKQKVKEDIL